MNERKPKDEKTFVFNPKAKIDNSAEFMKAVKDALTFWTENKELKEQLASKEQEIKGLESAVAREREQFYTAMRRVKELEGENTKWYSTVLLLHLDIADLKERLSDWERFGNVRPRKALKALRPEKKTR